MTQFNKKCLCNDGGRCYYVTKNDYYIQSRHTTMIFYTILVIKYFLNIIIFKSVKEMDENQIRKLLYAIKHL